MSGLLDKSRIEIKLGSYATAPASALTDNRLLSRIQAFRRQIGARMIAMDRHQAKRKIPNGDFHVSRKIDGEFNVLVFDSGESILVNPGGTVRTGLPFLEEAGALFKKAKVKNALVAGELHVRKPDGSRTRVHDVSRIVRKPETQEAVDSLCFAAFDLIEIDGEDIAGADFDTKWKQITSIFENGNRILPVESVSGSGAKDILDRFEKWVDEENAEGVVARSEAAGWFKVKPRHTLDVAVIGFAEGTDDRAGMLHDLLLGIARKDGSWQVLGRVGGGFSDDDRREFLSDLRDLAVESEYAEVNSDRVAYEMIRPEWVVEISCLELISQTTRGGTIDRMVLNWNGDAKKWETTRRLPLCSVISPQFIRQRDDKEPTPDDCRFDQLTDLVEIPLADSTAGDLDLPRSEILKREVRVKELKGKMMVRKLVLWKTNKEEESRGEFPAFVAHLTDFSPNRKTPMNREIRVSDSKAQIDELYAELAEKFFVGGWKEPDSD